MFVFSIEGIRMMDWDQLATVSQLVTGAATLAVAVFLWNQLKVQHRDSEREFAFANENRQQNLNVALFADEPTGKLLWKGSTDWDSLSPDEHFRFRYLLTQRYVNSWNAWRLRRDGENVNRFRGQWELLLEHPGQRRFHEEHGRDLLRLAEGFKLDPNSKSLFNLIEEVYEELESQAA